MAIKTKSSNLANIFVKAFLLIVITNILVGCGTYGRIPRERSTPRKILSVSPEVQKDSIKLVWQTDESDGGGFNIYRSVGNSTKRLRINSDIIRPESVNGGVESYVFKDRNIKPGGIYNYTLEDINTSKITSHGPISVIVNPVK